MASATGLGQSLAATVAYVVMVRLAVFCANYQRGSSQNRFFRSSKAIFRDFLLNITGEVSDATLGGEFLSESH